MHDTSRDAPKHLLLSMANCINAASQEYYNDVSPWLMEKQFSLISMKGLAGTTPTVAPSLPKLYELDFTGPRPCATLRI